MNTINCPHCNGLMNVSVSQEIQVVSAIGEVSAKVARANAQKIPVLTKSKVKQLKMKPITYEIRAAIRKNETEGWKDLTYKKLASQFGIRLQQVAAVVAHLHRK
jgi:hypothetical protein